MELRYVYYLEDHHPGMNLYQEEIWYIGQYYVYNPIYDLVL